MTDFHRLIQAARPNRRSDIFREFTKELTAHLLKRGKLLLPESEIKKRKKRIDKIKKNMIKLDNKIKKYSSREVSLDDLENGEDGPLEKKRRCEKKVIRLYTELRKLENRHQYYGEDEIDFNDVTEHPDLNQILADHVLKKFVKKKEQPDFVEINEIVEKFSAEKGILLDSARIFKLICRKFKEFRAESFEFTLNAHLDDEDREVDPYEEDEELRQKLDQNQNNFKTELDKVVMEFSKKVENLQDAEEEDEESEDSESDSLCEDENELESISEQEEEFLSPEECDSLDESMDESDHSELENDAIKASCSKSNSEATLKRTQLDTEEAAEITETGVAREKIKKMKFDDSDSDIIVLDE